MLLCCLFGLNRGLPSNTPPLPVEVTAVLVFSLASILFPLGIVQMHQVSAVNPDIIAAITSLGYNCDEYLLYVVAGSIAIAIFLAFGAFCIYKNPEKTTLIGFGVLTLIAADIAGITACAFNLYNLADVKSLLASPIFRTDNMYAAMTYTDITKINMLLESEAALIAGVTVCSVALFALIAGGIYKVLIDR